MTSEDTPSDRDRLIFVYNADSGVFSAIMDSAHKLFAPKTYQCSLCAVTHGALTMRSEWKSYIEALPYETRFYHRDGFRKQWPGISVRLPAVFIQRPGSDPELLMRADKLDAQRSVAQLTAALGNALMQKRAEEKEKEKAG